MPTVLVLFPGSGEQRRALVRRSRAWLDAERVRLVLADDEPEPADAEVFDDVVKLPPAERVREVVEELEAYAKDTPIGGVHAQSEAALPAGSVLAHRLGVRGIPLEGALRCVSKHQTRVALAGQRVGSPRWMLVESADEVRRFAEEEAGWPVVLKAVSSTMARLVTKVDGPDQVEAAVERVRSGIRRSKDIERLADFGRAADLELGSDPKRQFLVESYAYGEPVEFDGLAAGGAVHAYGVVQQIQSMAPLFYLEAYLLPAQRPRAEIAAIESTALAALRACRVDDAGFSVELRWSREGVQVIEVNGRIGEDEGYGDLFREASGGGDPHGLALRVALGHEIRIDAPKACWALAFTSWYRGGRVRAVPSEDELKELRHHAVLGDAAVEAGDELAAAPDPECFPHLAWALAKDPASSAEAWARARGALHALSFRIAGWR